MTSSCKDNIENYYQLADGVAPAGTELANSELIDFATGLPLIDDTTDEVLTGDSLETTLFSDIEIRISLHPIDSALWLNTR